MNTKSSDRLIIRRPKLADLNDFLKYRNDLENLRFQNIEIMSEEKALIFLYEQIAVDYHKPGGWIMFSIELVEESKMIGEVGIYISPEHSGDIGWSLNKDYQGKGYAGEAAELLLHYCFTVFGLHQISAACNSANLASLRIMQKIGMQFKSKEDVITGEGTFTEYIYSLSREEWNSK